MSRSPVSDVVSSLQHALQPAVSPDGTRVAYVVTGVDPDLLFTSYLAVSGIDGGSPQRLTWRDVPVGSPEWTPDGQSIAFVTPRDDGAHEINLLPVAGGEARVLARVETSPSDLVFSPDGSMLAYVARVDGDRDEGRTSSLPPVRVIRRLDYKEDGLGLPNNEHAQLFVLDVASGETRQLTSGTYDHGTLAWSPDGSRLGSIERTRIGLTSRLRLVDIATGTQQRFGSEKHAVRGWSWSPDGSRLLVFRSEHPEYGGAFFLIDAVTGSERQLTGEPRWAIDYTGSAIVWQDEAYAIVSGYEDARSGLWRLTIDTGELERIGLYEAGHYGVWPVPASSKVLLFHQSPTEIGDLVVVDTSDGALTNITSLNEGWLRDHPPARIEHHTTMNEGLEIGYLLKKPADFDSGRVYPVIFEIHGGPHMFRGFEVEMSNQLLIDAGYLVVCPNPRGSLSFGTDFARGVIGDWGGGDWRDILAVLDTVSALPYVDADRVGIYGYSYGGYMTSWAVGQTDRFRAAVIGAPLTDLLLRDGTSDIGYAAEWLEYEGLVADIGGRLAEQSPISHVHRATTPSLILHPEEDQRCPIGQSEQFFLGLNRAGVETEFVRYPGQSHLMPWFGPAEYRIDYHTRILDWFAKYL